MTTLGILAPVPPSVNAARELRGRPRALTRCGAEGAGRQERAGALRHVGLSVDARGKVSVEKDKGQVRTRDIKNRVAGTRLKRV